MKSEINLLDCTLRDGGYLNDWEFGKDNIINIYERLVSAEVDIIETGFIDERRIYDPNRSIFPDTESIGRTYGKLSKGNSMIVGMIDYGTCGIEHVQPQTECYLDGIRVIFKKHKMDEAIAFCKQIKDLGYKVFVQAVSITSYNDEELERLSRLVNNMEPYAFSLVDTYGLLHRGRLMHYFNFVCSHLKESIAIGYHAHNNFQLAYANCIELLDNPPNNRTMIVDGTLYGMGKSAGNTPIELLIMYMNEHYGTHYHNSQIMEAIDVTMLDIRRQITWGYSFKFFLSASHDCHPNYVSYLLDLGKLSIKSVGEILDQIETKRKLTYDAEYIRELYLEYQKNHCDDTDAKVQLQRELRDKYIIVLGPGQNVYKQRDRVDRYIKLMIDAGRKRSDIVLISINFIPEGYDVDYVFMSNAKRYVQLCSALNEKKGDSKLIATSNITRTLGEFDYTLNYSELLDEEAMMPDNPMIMMLKLLKDLGVCYGIALAGFDGYKEASLTNYVNPNMEYTMSESKAIGINNDAVKGIEKLGMSDNVIFITDTLYII